MMIKSLLILAFNVSLVLGDLIASAKYEDGGSKFEHSTWGYPSQEKDKLILPEDWGTINPLCSTGKEQSPVNIQLRNLKKTATKFLPPLILKYETSEFDVFHNRHTVQGTVKSGTNKVIFNDKEYFLKQFHHHRKSEHLIDGEQFFGELHFVHQNKDQELLVLAVLADTTGKSTSFQKSVRHLFKNYPGKSDRFKSSQLKINTLDFIPENRQFVNYKGSLTTPPCSENVTWIVFTEIMKFGEIDQKLMKEKKFDVGFLNFRPHFELSGRSMQLGLDSNSQ